MCYNITMSKGVKKILIVEDEKPMSKALLLKLTKAGFEAQSVANGEEALVLLEKEKFDLILLDLVMPKVDGFKVLQTMKERHLTTPVIVLSNLSQGDDDKRVKEFGVKDFFIKSDIPIAEVVERVKNLLK